MLHETTKKFMEGFRYSAHPMSMFVSTIAALSSVYPEAKLVRSPADRMHQIVRLIGKVPSIAAMSYRHNVGFPYVYPDNDLSYTENFMNMLLKMVEPKKGTQSKTRNCAGTGAQPGGRRICSEAQTASKPRFLPGDHV